MKKFQLATLTIAMFTLAGCSSMGLESKRVDYKSAAAKVPSLEIPPDLTVPTSEDHYRIPGEDGSVASYSDFSHVGKVSSSVVLPISRSVRLVHSGNQRWLEVDDKAENLWPAIKAFWQENGFAIKVEDPHAGVLETDWAENRAKIPKTGLRSLLGKYVDGLYDSGELDMYRVRLERSKDNASTLVYLAQYGKEEVLSEDKSSSKWQSRPNDSELEATMLQMLMIKLGGTEAQASADGGSAQSVHTPPQLQTRGDGSKVVLLSEPFDRGWRTVGLALEHVGFAVEDRDRASGVYYLHIKEEVKESSWFDSLAFWRSNDEIDPDQKTDGKSWMDSLAFWRSDSKNDRPGRYLVRVRPDNEGSIVSASNGKGESNTNSQLIIEKLFKSITK
ncbi:MAG: outer membrane protein assembly factor BamC [Gallionellaceae bacterium]